MERSGKMGGGTIIGRAAGLIPQRLRALGGRVQPGKPAIARATPSGRPAAGEHERRIAAHFAGRCRWDGEGPALDRDLLVLGFTNRSGSNLLADYLRQTRLVQSAGENLNWSGVTNHATREGIATFPDYIRFLTGIGPARPHFGVKASWEQLAMLHRWNIPAMFGACRVIVIQRRSVLRQAVSLSIAQQTRQWSSRQAGNGAAPVYDARAILQIMQSIERSNAMLARLCEALGLRHTTLHYEDLLRDPEGVVRVKLREIGIDCPPLELAAPAISRQSNHVNEDFVARMRAHLRDELGLPGPEGAA